MNSGGKWQPLNMVSTYRESERLELCDRTVLALDHHGLDQQAVIDYLLSQNAVLREQLESVKLLGVLTCAIDWSPAWPPYCAKTRASASSTRPRDHSKRAGRPALCAFDPDRA